MARVGRSAAVRPPPRPTPWRRHHVILPPSRGRTLSAQSMAGERGRARGFNRGAAGLRAAGAGAAAGSRSIDRSGRAGRPAGERGVRISRRRRPPTLLPPSLPAPAADRRPGAMADVLAAIEGGLAGDARVAALAAASVDDLDRTLDLYRHV